MAYSLVRLKKIAIIGSGLASTSVAKSLVKRGVKPIIFDIGRKLDNERQKIIDRMSKLEPEIGMKRIG